MHCFVSCRNRVLCVVCQVTPRECKIALVATRKVGGNSTIFFFFFLCIERAQPTCHNFLSAPIRTNGINRNGQVYRRDVATPFFSLYSSLGNFDLLYQATTKEQEKKGVCCHHRSLFALRAVAYASSSSRCTSLWGKDFSSLLLAPSFRGTLGFSPTCFVCCYPSIHRSSISTQSARFLQTEMRPPDSLSALSCLPKYGEKRLRTRNYDERMTRQSRELVRPAAVESFLKIK